MAWQGQSPPGASKATPLGCSVLLPTAPNLMVEWDPPGDPVCCPPPSFPPGAAFGCSSGGHRTPPHPPPGCADSAASGPAFRWERSEEQRGKNNSGAGECAELPSPNSPPRLPPHTPPHGPFPASTPGAEPLVGTGTPWGCFRRGAACLSFPMGLFFFWGGGTRGGGRSAHVHLVHVHDGGRRAEGAQAVADPLLQRHPPKLAVVAGPPAAGERR